MTHTCSILILIALAMSAALARAAFELRSLRARLQAALDLQGTCNLEGAQLASAKDEFIADVAHELRTPLTSIRGALALLSSGLLAPVDPRAQNLLRIALSNTDRLIRLLNDVLDLDRLSSAPLPLQLRRCSMRELAQQSIDTMTSQADAARVRLYLLVEAPPEALFFDGDPDRILQVLTNLLSNAIKFSPPSAVVEIRIDSEPETLRLRVLDRGRGIPAEKLASIFDRFEQVEPADAREKGGAGLGLAICRSIIEQHSGAIWAESNSARQPGAGASLFFTLPRTARRKDSLGRPQAAPVAA